MAATNHDARYLVQSEHWLVADLAAFLYQRDRDNCLGRHISLDQRHLRWTQRNGLRLLPNRGITIIMWGNWFLRFELFSRQWSAVA